MPAKQGLKQQPFAVSVLPRFWGRLCFNQETKGVAGSGVAHSDLVLTILEDRMAEPDSPGISPRLVPTPELVSCCDTLS